MDEKQQILRAVNRGDIEALRKMNDNSGLDWSKCVYDKTGDSALHVAARTGHLLLMRFGA
jgi:ankyrin repeat protein